LDTFTSIGFGIKDVNQPLKFAKYVPPIFEYMKKLSSDEYNSNIDILKSITGFAADMVNLYGHEIKVLIQQEFIFKIMEKLKAAKIKKLENHISWVEDVKFYIIL